MQKPRMSLAVALICSAILGLAALPPSTILAAGQPSAGGQWLPSPVALSGQPAFTPADDEPEDYVPTEEDLADLVPPDEPDPLAPLEPSGEPDPLAPLEPSDEPDPLAPLVPDDGLARLVPLSDLVWRGTIEFSYHYENEESKQEQPDSKTTVKIKKREESSKTVTIQVVFHGDSTATVSQELSALEIRDVSGQAVCQKRGAPPTTESFFNTTADTSIWKITGSGPASVTINFDEREGKYSVRYYTPSLKDGSFQRIIAYGGSKPCGYPMPANANVTLPYTLDSFAVSANGHLNPDNPTTINERIRLGDGEFLTVNLKGSYQ